MIEINMGNNNIAVLLPVYTKDNPNYFSLSVESILQQTYSQFTIYIGVDGPVNDALAQVIEEFVRDTRVKPIWFDQNRGLACVLNDLIDIAIRNGADFFARMDADDISLPDRFEKQLNHLLANPDIDVVGGAIEEVDSEGNPNGKIIKYPALHEECRRFFRYRDPLAHPATFFRRSFFDKTKGYRNEYRKNQDTMLWFDGFNNGCIFSNLSDVILKFRVDNSFYCRRNGMKRAKQMFRDRLKINRALNYDISANIFAFAMFMMTISPKFIKKLLYKIR